MLYQLGWTTLPGLRGLSVSAFRATPTEVPDNERGVALEFASETGLYEFLQAAEAQFALRRFSNAADAFDSVKVWVLQHAGLEASKTAMKRSEWPIRVLNNEPESIMRAKDEEYSFWQSRTPLERLVAMQELSLALFEECSDEVEIRQQFLRSPVCLRRA